MSREMMIDGSEHPPRIPRNLPEHCEACGREIEFRELVYTCDDIECRDFAAALNALSDLVGDLEAEKECEARRWIERARAAFRMETEGRR